MRSIVIEGITGRSEILVGHSVSELPKYVGNSRAVLAVDTEVVRRHRDKLPDWPIIEVLPGEDAKNLDSVNKLYQQFLDLELDRSCTVVAVGGGAVLDVAAFAANTYLRGLRCGMVPTTLLAQADASIGGKNGVNFGGFKNLVGTFRQPDFVLCDTVFFDSLPEQIVRSGFAEVIKHAAIGNERLFEYIEDHAESIAALDNDRFEHVLHSSLLVKTHIVEGDELERDERRKLNYGHTVGHAIESVHGLHHGESVSIGMVVAAEIAEKRGMLTAAERERLAALLKRFGLPTAMDVCDGGALFEALHHDKKRQGDVIFMPLLTKIGDCRIVAIPLQTLKEALDDLCKSSPQ